MVQQKKSSGESTNGTNKKEYPNMSFQRKDISDVRVMGSNAGKGDVKQNGSTVNSQNNFRTDSAISSARPGRERTLQPWVGPSTTDGIDLSLEKSSSGGGTWDQFAANERQFGIKSTYDENIYTTAIDKSHPQYKERMAAAERKAREIERSTATTAHVAEERVMDYVGGDDAGVDEEDKYSGVKRQDFPPLPNSRENKYTPPARRAPTASSTVKGAPVDPAIISSQLKTQKNQAAAPPKQDDNKPRVAAPRTETSVPSTVRPTETKVDAKVDSQQKPTESKGATPALTQSATPFRASAATSRTISPTSKDGQGVVPSATSTVEHDVLKEFKTFANQQRTNAEKVRSTKAKADKEAKLTELKKFADSFKLPTQVPTDLIPIIAKDPAKQREIQEKAKRDAAEVAKKKAEEAAAKEKKGTSTKEVQPAPTSQAASDTRTTRPNANPPNVAPAAAPARHPGNRQSFAPNYSYQGNRPGPQHMQQGGRQGNLSGRLRHIEAQKAQGQDVRLPPTGPANTTDPSFGRRMGGVSGHMSAKLNPNSHEFRPSPFAQTFNPNGHPSGGSSPRSAINHSATELQSGSTNSHTPLTIVTKKKKAIDTKKCNILYFIKTIQPPENKNWNDNGGLRPSYDTPPAWRALADDEKPDSTMRLSLIEYFERQPFNTHPTPNPPHLLPQMAHQHQLPLHMQHGAHPVAPRHSPHVPPVQIHGGQHGPVPHAPFNGADDHRMMHSNSSQSYSSPRMGQVPMVYPPNMNPAAQMPYNQHMVPFMGPAAPPMNQFNRSFSNTPQYVPQQPGGMGTPMMMQQQFMAPQPMVAGPPQMQPYPAAGHMQFMPPNATPPQPMPGANGYPSPGRPTAPMMVHQGSQQGQPYIGMSPGMQYQQPTFVPQQQGQSKFDRRYSNQNKYKKTNKRGEVNNMRGYSNPNPQQFGTSPQQPHQYGPPHRNGSNNFNKNYQGHNQHQGPQGGGHAIPSGPQGRSSDGPDEAK
ncbi:uncharacterized protein F4822DRAFT_253180 [Hypoxylon trugodes]|uniref:uncharacterized protein n=1 Tax=Hypoxylon trugodes TaxID=326681 RepID=UPI00219EE34C|nr:uncharacterized protein F4822DRAFT_253180 [Hypoxylon trugodes]KAI1388678.1 hypothetical protein F4822DRAFT_253180 [Hypoxylon trugodes]